MKIIASTTFAALVLASLSSARAAEPIINLSIGGEISPGVYGQIQFNNSMPPPPVVYARPVIVVHEHETEELEPIYLHVPPGHAKHWSRHCYEYNACNRQVYFVRSAEYEPGYSKHRGRSEEVRQDEEHREEWRNEDHDDEGYRGRGRGHGRGRDHDD